MPLKGVIFMAKTVTIKVHSGGKKEDRKLIGERNVQIPTSVAEAVKMWEEGPTLNYAIRSFTIDTQRSIKSDLTPGKGKTDEEMIATLLARNPQLVAQKVREYNKK